MTELTFAELTALIAVNGLVINDRYLITDKNWTIIAITTSSYRIIVPIMTEVTKAQLDALVAANGLNEGLQYKVTDKSWLLIAISNSLLMPINNILNIENGDILPIYIDSENINIFIPTMGVIPPGLSSSDTLEIIIPGGYYPVSIQLEVEATADVANYYYDNTTKLQLGNEDMGVAKVNQSIPMYTLLPNPPQLTISHSPNTTAEIFNAIVFCKKFSI